MLWQSNHSNGSSNSNLLTLSRSSASSGEGSANNYYRKFISKVGQLFKMDSGDLDALYGKIVQCVNESEQFTCSGDADIAEIIQIAQNLKHGHNLLKNMVEVLDNRFLKNNEQNPVEDGMKKEKQSQYQKEEDFVREQQLGSQHQDKVLQIYNQMVSLTKQKGEQTPAKCLQSELKEEKSKFLQEEVNQRDYKKQTLTNKFLESNQVNHSHSTYLDNNKKWNITGQPSGKQDPSPKDRMAKLMAQMNNIRAQLSCLQVEEDQIEDEHESSTSLPVNAKMVETKKIKKLSMRDLYNYGSQDQEIQQETEKKEQGQRQESPFEQKYEKTKKQIPQAGENFEKQINNKNKIQMYMSKLEQRNKLLKNYVTKIEKNISAIRKPINNVSISNEAYVNQNQQFPSLQIAQIQTKNNYSAPNQQLRNHYRLEIREEETQTKVAESSSGTELKNEFWIQGLNENQEYEQKKKAIPIGSSIQSRMPPIHGVKSLFQQSRNVQSKLDLEDQGITRGPTGQIENIRAKVSQLFKKIQPIGPTDEPKRFKNMQIELQNNAKRSPQTDLQQNKGKNSSEIFQPRVFISPQQKKEEGVRVQNKNPASKIIFSHSRVESTKQAFNQSEIYQQRCKRVQNDTNGRINTIFHPRIHRPSVFNQFYHSPPSHRITFSQASTIKRRHSTENAFHSPQNRKIQPCRPMKELKSPVLRSLQHQPVQRKLLPPLPSPVTHFPQQSARPQIYRLNSSVVRPFPQTQKIRDGKPFNEKSGWLQRDTSRCSQREGGKKRGISVCSSSRSK